MNQTDSWTQTQQYVVKLTKHAVDDDETGVFEPLTLVSDSTYHLVRFAVFY